ncbi:glycosyltransferase family 2 protein [Castellaniella sp.]|uniref:glycosyltransferase family 2 protein n=1 Tax=Castellaniella sp. TaxID=1955812 RepID=UPI00356233F5
MPRVSVLLTSYNHQTFIEQAIQSVLGQTFSDFELLILDDASTDASWTLISRQTDARIQARRSDRPAQIISMVNQAITDAAGEYIAMHHSDDAWAPEKLERQVAWLDAHPDVAAVFTWVQMIDEYGNKVHSEWLNRPHRSRWVLLRNLFDGTNALCHPSVLIRKRCYEKLGAYRYGLAQTDDAEMWSRVLQHYPVDVLPERLTLFRRFSNRSNISGERADVFIRISNEWNILRQNYLALASFDDFVQVFPEFESWRHPDGYHLKFLLAMACVTSAQPNAWQLGLRWLYEVVNDTASRESVERLYGFSDISYIYLAGVLDSYMVKAASQHMFVLDGCRLADDGVMPGYPELEVRLIQRNERLQKAMDRQAWWFWRAHRRGVRFVRRVRSKVARTLAHRV